MTISDMWDSQHTPLRPNTRHLERDQSGAIEVRLTNLG